MKITIAKEIICMVFIIGLLSGCVPHYMPHGEIDLNKADEKLFLAIENDNLEMAKEAVEVGADINYLSDSKLRDTLWDNKKEGNPLLLAMMRGSKSIMNYLIDKGANVNYTNKQGRSVLSYAVSHRADIVDKLIEKGADINYIDKEGDTILDYALSSGVNILKYDPVIRKTTVEQILKQMVENSENTDNYIDLKNLIDSDKKIDLPEEIKNSFDDNTDNLKKYSGNKKYNGIILSATAAFKDKECLKNLYEREDIEKSVSTNHLCRMAAVFGNIENIKYLLNVGADINSRDDKDFSPIELAVMNNQTETVKYLLSLNVDLTPSKTYGNNRDALGFSIENHNMEIFKMLIPYRQNESRPYYHVGRAMDTAIASDNIEALKYLLDIGVDPNYGYPDDSLLGKAILWNNMEAVKILVSYGANISPNMSKTPLYEATRNGCIEIAKYLIENGAYIDAPEGYKESNVQENIPVFSAIIYGQLDCLKILIESGADTSITYYGKSILELAKDSGSDNIYNYLKGKVQ